VLDNQVDMDISANKTH